MECAVYSREHNKLACFHTWKSYGFVFYIAYGNAFKAIGDVYKTEPIRFHDWHLPVANPGTDNFKILDDQ